MQALVLEQKDRLALRDFPLSEPALGPHDVRVAIRTVGVCGSDVHYYTHGKIGPFVVREPMILGHEAAGVVEEVGAEVTGLKKGDRVYVEAEARNNNYERKVGTETVKFYETEFHAAAIERVALRAEAEAEE